MGLNTPNSKIITSIVLRSLWSFFACGKSPPVVVPSRQLAWWGSKRKYLHSGVGWGCPNALLLGRISKYSNDWNIQPFDCSWWWSAERIFIQTSVSWFWKAYTTLNDIGMKLLRNGTTKLSRTATLVSRNESASLGHVYYMHFRSCLIPRAMDTKMTKSLQPNHV